MAKAHDPEVKQRALMLARNVGPAEAAKRTGLNVQTIKTWLHRSGGTDAAHETRERISRGVRLTHEQRRQSLAEGLLRIAEGYVEAIAIPQKGALSDLDEVKTATIVIGVVVDKLERMRGDGGSSEDQVIEVDLGSIRRPKESTAAAG
jgi:transposase-like protein